jgi:hypothetical protein
VADDDLRTLYQSTQEDPVTADTTAIARRAAELDRTLNRRNGLELLAAGVVIAAFGGQALFAADLLHAAGPALTVVGALVVAGGLLRRGRAPAADPAAPTLRHLDAHRRELEHQAALLRAVPLWYLGPLLPGMALTLGVRLVDTDGAPAVWATIGLCAVFFVGVGWLNLRAARALEAEAEALGGDERGDG